MTFNKVSLCVLFVLLIFVIRPAIDESDGLIITLAIFYATYEIVDLLGDILRELRKKT